jgi:uncharacterized membrane protein YeaQ/YmgE (transglycosylase-associated protein family)
VPQRGEYGLLRLRINHSGEGALSALRPAHIFVALRFIRSIPVTPGGHPMGRGIIWFLVVGLIAGWLAGKIMKGSGYGVVGDLVVGILGAIIGGWVFGVLGIAAWGLLGRIIMALAGALILLYLVRLVKRG